MKEKRTYTTLQYFIILVIVFLVAVSFVWFTTSIGFGSLFPHPQTTGLTH